MTTSGSIEEEHEPVVEPEEDTRPSYMKDEAPSGKINYIKWALLHGKTEDVLRAEGSNSRSVDICAQELEKEGLRKRPEKPLPPPKDLTVPGVDAKSPQVFAKGSPPEAIIEGMRLPISNGKVEGFEHGMKFGASIVVLGVRIAQELSQLGIQQARPIMEMAKGMREGEAAAAKSAAGEAAMMAATQVQQGMMPYLAAMTKQQQPVGDNPMKAMMARTMEPMMGRIMNKIFPGMQDEAPPGWSKRQE